MQQPPLHPKLRNATDDFIGQTLPAWLRRASVDQVKALRSSFSEHRASQAALRAALDNLQSPTSFAKAVLASALQAQLGQAVDLDKAQWRTRALVFEAAFNRTEFRNNYAPALRQFMQNFEKDQAFFPGTALIYPADAPTQQPEQVLSAHTDALVKLCRETDAGGDYQKHLDEIFDENFRILLARDRRGQLALATQIAQLKGQLSEADANMLQRVSSGQAASYPGILSVACGELTLLGARLEGALAFELRGAWEFLGPGSTLPLRPVEGVLLYLPHDIGQPLRHYPNWNAASLALGRQAREAGYRQALEKRIALADRAAYQATLAKRLADPETDLQASLSVVKGDLFEGVARRYLQRIRDDARMILVPTAAVDAKASSAWLKALEGAGLVMLNLAGMFVPAIGAVLLADLVARTLARTFEGFEDWRQGHQHEALDHLLGVAQTVAAVGAGVAAGSVVRSAFVDGLAPVNTETAGPRLWSGTLEPYADTATPADLVEQDNGLLSNADGDWWRDDKGVAYRVRPTPGRSTWQLCHPSRGQAFAPELESNGERGWRLAFERPLEWQGERYLLGRLWPQALGLDEVRVAQVLKVAAVDEVQLRGLLVEARPLPVALRDTLERFATEARIEAFFVQLRGGELSDSVLLGWCVERLNIFTLNEAEQSQAILDNAGTLREPMFEHFSHQYLAQAPQLTLIQRDFPGLPDAYALRLLQSANDDQRQRMLAESRIPLALAEQARALLREARLTRMREALYLSDNHDPQGVELVFALLARHAAWPMSSNLVLREGSDAGRALARLYPEGETGQQTTTLVWRDGRYWLYDQDGRVSTIEPAEPAGLPQVLAACLPEAHRQRLGWAGSDASTRIMADLRGWLPADDQALGRLVGLREIRPWYNPLRRQADGRLGYALSGRRGGRLMSERILRDRVRALYSGFGDREVDLFVSLLLERPGTAYSNLLQHEQAYRQLDEALQAWVAEERAVARRDMRRSAADSLRRSWRLEGEPVMGEPGVPEGRRLSLIGIALGSLPELPSGTDFAHVTELTLVGLRLERLPRHFLRSFPQLRRLELSNNALRALPEDIGRLRNLRSLGLARNQIRMTSAGVRVLRDLPLLRNLDLNVNPLGSISLDFRQLSRLSEINLRRTGLRTVPSGLEWCGFLEYADLRDNHIASLPQALLDAPYELRRTLDFSGNPLPAAVRQRLHSPRGVPEPEGAGANGLQADDARQAWLDASDASQRSGRAAQWDALRAEPGSYDFFQLLQELTGSSDYRRARSDLGRRVWEVLAEAQRDSALRGELFDLAASPRTCVDSVASSFSALEVRVFVARAVRERTPVQALAQRLALARRLFRLDQVERIAQADIAQRRAAGTDVDEVEVSLAYRTGLAFELELPGQPRTMQFRAIAGVSDDQLEAAAALVRTREAGAGLAEYISQRDFWVEYLRQRYAQRFEAVEQPFWDDLDVLEQSTQPEGERLRAMNQLALDREKAQQQLALQLTREALAEH